PSLLGPPLRLARRGHGRPGAEAPLGPKDPTSAGTRRDHAGIDRWRPALEPLRLRSTHVREERPRRWRSPPDRGRHGPRSELSLDAVLLRIVELAVDLTG